MPARRRAWLSPPVGSAIAVAIVAFATAHHERRDEIDAWLVVRDIQDDESYCLLALTP